MNKEVIFFYSCKNLHDMHRILSNDYYHIKNISTHFNNIKIINLSNLKFFKKKYKIHSNILKKFKYNKKVSFHNPYNFTELQKILGKKKYNSISCIQLILENFIIFYYLKKLNLNLFQISNIGNVQYSDVPIKKNILRSYASIYNKKFLRKIYVILVFFKIFPKYKIRFVSNRNWLIRKNSLSSKLIDFLNLKSYEKILSINSRSYDMSLKNKKKIKKKYIVVLDEPMNDYQYIALRGKIEENDIKKYHSDLSDRLTVLSKALKKDVIICIHPNDSLKYKRKIYPKFKVKQFETKKFIFQARIVIFTESSASIDAIMNYIPLISKDSQFYDENQKYHNSHYVEHLDIPVINLDKRFDYTLLSKIKNFTPNRKKYKDYIKKFVAPDKSSLPGHLKFAQIIYKEFNIYE